MPAISHISIYQTRQPIQTSSTQPIIIIKEYSEMSRQQDQKNKNVAVLKEALKVAEETNTAAINTNADLHGQGQKMTGVDQKLTKINTTLDKTEDSAKEITSYWYYLKNKVKRVLGIKKKVGVEDDLEEAQTVSSRNGGKDDKKVAQTFAQGSSGEQDEEDQILQELLNRVKQTKGHGKDMGTELDRQQAMLGRIEGKFDRADDKLTKVNKMLKKQLK